MGRKPTEVERKVRPARKVTGLHPRVLAAQLYELHAVANRGEPYLEQWPGDSELYGVLVFGQAHAKRITGRETCQQASLLRIQLAEWLREQADPLQLAALEDAHEAKTGLARIAMVLGFVRNVDGKVVPIESSAWKRWRRLRVAVHGRPEDRRQPEVARVIEERAAREELACRERERTGDARYPEVDAAARALLRHYEAGELAADPDDDFWWDQLSSVIDDRQGTADRAALLVYVRGVVRETYAYATRVGQGPAETDQARRSLEDAAALVDSAEGAG